MTFSHSFVKKIERFSFVLRKKSVFVLAETSSRLTNDKINTAGIRAQFEKLDENEME